MHRAPRRRSSRASAMRSSPNRGDAPASEDRASAEQLLEQRAVALDGDALEVEVHPALAPELLAAAGAPRPAVDHLRQDRARTGRVLGDLLAADVDPPVVGRDA